MQRATGVPGLGRRAPTAWQGGLSIIGLATITAALTGPGQTIGVSVFTDHFVDDLGLSRSNVSLAYLIGTLTGAVLLPTVGRFIDQRGVRFAQIIVGTLFALALLNMSFVGGFAWLALGFVGIRFLGQGSLSLVAIITVSLRYVENRGRALGVFSTSSAGLMALVPVGLAISIDEIGWRSTWRLAAAVVVVVVVPIAVLGLRQMPRSSAAASEADAAFTGRASVDRSAAIRTRSFWILAAVSGSAGMMSTALNFHQIDLLGDVGISETGAAALFIPQVLGSTIAGLGIGWSADRIGTRYLPALGMLLLVSAHVLAAIAAPGAIAILYAVVLGAAGEAVRTATAVLLPMWFGTRHLGSIQGSLTLLNVGASALGPVALAVVDDRFGSYPPAVMLLAAIPTSALLFSLTRDRAIETNAERIADPIDSSS